ncbi:MAG: gliding motility-associated C-terminal domain-containing protein [Chitinophagales bacterium]
MRKYFYTIILLFISYSLSAQTPAWAFNIGSITDDFSTTCKVAPNGNVYIAGEFTGTMDLDPGPGVYNITSNGLSDIFVACYTSTGTFLWGFGIGGPSYDGAWYLTIDRFNNVFVCGHIQSGGIDFDPGPGVTILPYIGGTGVPYEGDGFIAKYSSTGVFQWAKDLGGTTVYDIALSLGTDELGNVYVGGVFDVTMTISASITFNSGTNGSAYLIKYDPAGNVVWGHNYGLPGTAATDCFPRSLQVSHGYIYVTGYFQGTSNFNPWGAGTYLTSAGFIDPYIAKYDTVGNLVFVKQIACSGGTDDEFGSLALDPSDNIYVIGWINSPNVIFDPSAPATSTFPSPGGGGNFDIIMAKFNSNGIYQWGAVLGGTGDDIGRCIDASGTDIVCTGEFHNTVDFDPSPAVSNLVSNGGFDVFVAKYNLNGNYLCGFNIGSPTTDDVGYGITHDPTGNVYNVGQFGGAAIDFDPTTGTYPLTSNGGVDAYLVKYNYIGPATFTGHLVGDTICTGNSAQLTVVVTSGGAGPYTITYSDGTTTHTQTVTGSSPFTVTPTPTVTTTYSLVSITNPGTGFCTIPSGAGFGTATIFVSPCTRCDSLSMPDSLHICIADTLTMPATLTGINPILSIAWTPVTGLSSTTILNPVLTATTSGWYYLTVQSLIPYNLVVNGDFSAGNTGFTSTYTYVSGPGSLMPEGTYAITPNPNLVHPGATSFGDHTTGSGNMMAVNGSGTPTSVWCQTIPVTPNTDYAFSAWVANWSAPGPGSAPILQFMIDGVLIGTPITITSAPGVWINFYAIWNSGTNTTANICIYDACTALSGNDFALDDISFQHMCLSRDSVYVKINQLDTTYSHKDTSICASVAPITLNAPTGYYPYLWNTGGSTSSISISTAGAYWVYATGTCGTLIDTFNVLIKTTPPPPHTRDTVYCKGFASPAPLDMQIDSVAGTLNWYLGGVHLNSTPTPSTAVATYPIGTTWYVSQTVNGCESNNAAVNVKIIAPPNSIIAGQPWVCQYDSISLVYTPESTPLHGSFLWSLPIGAASVDGTHLTDSLIIVQFDSINNNNYVYLTSTYLGGECSVNDTIRIDVIALPAANAYSKADVCLGDTVGLALSYKSPDAIDFAWHIDNSPLFSSGAITIISANSNSGGPFNISWADTGVHIIYVQAYAEHGCTDKPTTDTIEVHQLPDATFRITTLGGTLCLEDSVLFSANDSNYQNIYRWNPAHFFHNVGKYSIWGSMELVHSIVTLTITDPFGCTASNSRELDPSVCCNIPFPNAFTPNGDGLNDVFRPIPMRAYHRYHVFRIDNRWGQTVFECTDNKAEWDGTFNGVPQDIGVLLLLPEI